MKYNFSAGPSILPKQVLDNIAAGIINIEGSELSILELSHRGPIIQKVRNEAVSLIKELCHLPDDYHVLYLQGGATTQFAMIPQNFLSVNEKAAYIDTGVWSQKATKAASYYGKDVTVASSADEDYSYIPELGGISDNVRYLHFTSNNTIYGSQYTNYPLIDVPIVVDMSSDILSRSIDYSKFDLIYAGAQKNIGPAGATIVIIKDSFLKSITKELPSIYDYRAHVKGDSMLNTPPVFAMYGCMLNLQWLKEQGGAEAIGQKNKEKADTLYSALDRSDLFVTKVRKDSRSQMNVTFSITVPELEEEFLNFAASEGVVGIKGHRLTKGFRASLYNALPLSSVKVLVQVVQHFEQKHG